MGDKLRNAIGISATWTKEEIARYNILKLKELGPVYLMEGISVERPADRVRYLDLKLEIEDNGKEERDILTVAKKYGKASALKDLEMIAFRRFF